MIVSLLLAVGLMVAVVMGLRRLRRAGGASGGGASAIRRFFQYLLLYGLLIVVAIGLSGLLGRLFGGGELVRFSQAQLARSLAFALIGGPMYAGVALWSRRQIAEDPSETQSFGLLHHLRLHHGAGDCHVRLPLGAFLAGGSGEVRRHRAGRAGGMGDRVGRPLARRPPRHPSRPF